MKLFRKKNASHLLPKVVSIAHVDQGNSYVVIQSTSKGPNGGIEVRVKLSDLGKSEAMAIHLDKLERRMADLVKKIGEQQEEIAASKADVIALQALIQPVEVPKEVEVKKPETVKKKKAPAKKKDKE